MTTNPSIWDWINPADTDALFTELVTASEDRFKAIASGTLVDNPEIADPLWNGIQEVALCSSHMFFDDPYASMEYEDIDAQREERLTSYRKAISTAIGKEGARFEDFIGADPALLEDEKAFAIYEIEDWFGYSWVWPSADAIFFLAERQEDSELPIDISFGRSSVDFFAKLKSQVAAVLLGSDTRT